MIGRSLGVNLRSGRLAACALTLSLFSCAATAEARSPATPSHSRTAATAWAYSAQGDFADEVCDLLGKSVKYGVNQLIKWMTKGRVSGSLAGTLFNDIGFKPWCRKDYARLRVRLQGVVATKPALTTRLGPFAFNLHAAFTDSVLFPGYDSATVSWTEYTLSSPLRHFYLWYSLNGNPYRLLHEKTLYVADQDSVRFAVRIDNDDGISSPFIYSPTYS